MWAAYPPRVWPIWGTHVTGLDRDQHKVDSILAGRAPFYEPGLDDFIARNVAAGRLTACVSAAEALANAEIVLICVGTPTQRNGNQDSQSVEAGGERDCVLHGAPHGSADRRDPQHRSPPGTCEQIVMPILAGTPCVVVSNPEFLREGIAIQDFLYPGLLVVGGSDADAVREVAGIYAGVDTEAQLVSLRTAEMIKFACNAFHAVKIAFANEVGAISDSVGVDGG